MTCQLVRCLLFIPNQQWYLLRIISKSRKFRETLPKVTKVPHNLRKVAKVYSQGNGVFDPLAKVYSYFFFKKSVSIDFSTVPYCICINTYYYSILSRYFILYH